MRRGSDLFLPAMADMAKTDCRRCTPLSAGPQAQGPASSRDYAGSRAGPDAPRQASHAPRLDVRGPVDRRCRLDVHPQPGELGARLALTIVLLSALVLGYGVWNRRDALWPSSVAPLDFLAQAGLRCTPQLQMLRFVVLLGGGRGAHLADALLDLRAVVAACGGGHPHPPLRRWPALGAAGAAPRAAGVGGDRAPAPRAGDGAMVVCCGARSSCRPPRRFGEAWRRRKPWLDASPR